jgi:hypothetical protein
MDKVRKPSNSVCYIPLFVLLFILVLLQDDVNPNPNLLLALEGGDLGEQIRFSDGLLAGRTGFNSEQGKKFFSAP